MSNRRDLHPITAAVLFSHPFRKPEPRAPRPDAIRILERRNEPVQLGPVSHSGGLPLYDCPCGCGLWTSTPAQLCGVCEQLKPATHWDGLVNCCGDCAPSQYGE